MRIPLKLVAVLALLVGSLALIGPNSVDAQGPDPEIGLLPPAAPTYPHFAPAPDVPVVYGTAGPSVGAARADTATSAAVVLPGDTLNGSIDCGSGSHRFIVDLGWSGQTAWVGDDQYDSAGPGANAVGFGSQYWSVVNCTEVQIFVGAGDVLMFSLDPAGILGNIIVALNDYDSSTDQFLEDWRNDTVWVTDNLPTTRVAVYGFGGHDALIVDPGNTGPVFFDGGQGNDQAFGGAGDDVFIGGIGNDTLNLGAGNDTALGGPGNDRILGGPGGDDLRGEMGNDWVVGGNDTDLIVGGPGNDKLGGNGAYDEIYGETGDDRIWGGSHRDLISGGPGNDEINGLLGPDEIFGDGGDDILRGDPGNDTLVGGSGWDELYGGDGWDDLYGEDGNDLLAGGALNDDLFGGNGVDICRGNLGSDTATDCEDINSVP